MYMLKKLWEFSFQQFHDILWDLATVAECVYIDLPEKMDLPEIKLEYDTVLILILKLRFHPS